MNNLNKLVSLIENKFSKDYVDVTFSKLSKTDYLILTKQ